MLPVSRPTWLEMMSTGLTSILSPSCTKMPWTRATYSLEPGTNDTFGPSSTSGTNGGAGLTSSPKTLRPDCTFFRRMQLRERLAFVHGTKTRHVAKVGAAGFVELHGRRFGHDDFQAAVDAGLGQRAFREDHVTLQRFAGVFTGGLVVVFDLFADGHGIDAVVDAALVEKRDDFVVDDGDGPAAAHAQDDLHFVFTHDKFAAILRLGLRTCRCGCRRIFHSFDLRHIFAGTQDFLVFARSLLRPIVYTV